MKQILKLYLESKEIERLKQKALSCGFNGKGYLSHYISKVANEPIVFLSEEVIKLMRK